MILSSEANNALLETSRSHVWHPFTWMSPWLDSDPVIIHRAEGSFLFDTLGNKYLDGVSSLWVNIHGHGHPLLDKAVKDQIDLVSHSTLLGLSNVPSIQLASELVRVAPFGLSRVFYSDNGSTACEIALKMAFQYFQIMGETNRSEFIALENAYHGDTIGSVSVGGIPIFHQRFRPFLFPVHRVPSPFPYRSSFSCDPASCMQHSLDTLGSILDSNKDKIVAMIIEPLVQGAAGMIVHPEGFLFEVRKLLDAHGALLICDEVATGFGRTGTMFACEQEGVLPDLMTVAKGLTGGYLPVAATLTTESFFDVFRGGDPSTHTFFHGHTYTGNPLGCAVALASLRLFRQEQTLLNLQPKIAHLHQLLDDHIAPLPFCGDIRQKGMMVGIELVSDVPSKRSFPPSCRAGALVCLSARKHGVILRPLGDVIVLMPPLSISTSELDLLVEATRASICEVLPSLVE